MQLRCIGQLCVGDAWRGDKFRRLAVAERDRSRLVEEQRVYVARRFYGGAGHSHHVSLNDAVDSRDADGGKQPPIVVG